MSDDEEGGPASAIRALDVRAADLQEELTEQRFSVPSDPTKTAANPANIAASGASH
jgi:hypothetical protein